MNKKILNVLKLILFISLGLLLVWLSIRGLDEKTKKQTVEAFKKANYFWVFLSIVIGIISHWSRAVRWKMLMQPLGYSPRVSNTFFAVMVGYLANYAFPRLGEVTRCSLVSRYEKVPLNGALGTVIAERIIDVITMLTLFVLTLLLNATRLFDIVNEQIFLPIRENWGQKTDLLIALGIVAVVGLVLFFFFWNKIKQKLGSKAQNIIHGFSQGLKAVMKVKHLGAFIVHSLFIWAMYWLSLYLCFFSLPETSHLSIMDALVLLMLGSIAVAAPLPGGLGLYQKLVGDGLMLLFFVNAAASNAFPWIVWGSQFIMIVSVGLISLVLLAVLNRNTSKQ